ncbi:lipid A biosynthesis lauroyl acyltransferase [Mycoavidus cysteinexigens]|uniref:Lipid A biosynthesis lauroyl acyltransferase n=1 Tax=Mycoavidus cysteinexigens TaxID=1553431 RepID=A0A2Z6ES66_9BURK|nr:lipid A biosynthesis lauroyl acyltransferase [Mycoavidus cysteinexigens]BBE08235.1 lipid A biosynthesis lauroyl acyltransferase [Mycoavidus cysteinexigens]GAM53058.1 lipid A biosynthesis lauroyl acyltransferase [bacterium endosymbiont of Mortierella elongata FMR23-6]GLR02394.1 lipid A biosynthesis lauroyl acyltransferase [Mycoavidus cysteinexigens]
MLKQLMVGCALSLLKLLAVLPYGFVARFGDLLGRLLYKLPSKRRCIVYTNLKLCFPHWSETRCQAVAAHHFRHVIRSYVERSVQWFGSAKKFEKLVEIKSEIDLSDPNLPPTILLGFHFVGIEAGSISLNYALKRSCGALYQPMSNLKIDQAAKQARARFNAQMISRPESARTILRMLRVRTPVMLASDMDHGARNSAFVPFFGVPACTLTTVSRLAKTAQAQVVPFIGEVLPNYKGYRLKVFRPWENYPSDDPLADARRMNAFLEEQIELMPEQYYWVHKRFKTRPPGEPGFYDAC